MVKVGYAQGICGVCGRVWRATRPTDLVICDCYKFCPLCSPTYTVQMAPFTPDLTPSTYESEEALGITRMEDSPGKTIEVLYFCNNHSPLYYSRQKPVEVRLE